MPTAKVKNPASNHDVQLIGVVGFAHGLSHFFQLLLPPLFPWIKAEFALSYTELGLLMTTIFVISAGGQAAAGFLVDRFGPHISMFGGLACFTAGAAICAVASGYWTLMLGGVLLGLGNAVFHPVDYTILNKCVSANRLGPAYSVHGLLGNVGWGLAPIFLVGLAAPFGWRYALLAAGVLPVIVIVLWIWSLPLMRNAQAVPRGVKDPEPDQALAFLREKAIWGCIFFFLLVATALGAFQNFGPSVLMGNHAFPLETAAYCITVYMFGSAAGMFAGGWLVMKSDKLEMNITVALLLTALAAIMVGLQSSSVPIIFGLIALMGVGTGLSGPSRDMLIRAATPAGATGRSYGVVYSALDLGLAIGAPIFGALMDWGFSTMVFAGIGLCFLLAASTVLLIAYSPATLRTQPL
ncbi:MAG: MFS transporter [Pseudomonadota bacterium]